ncbi:DUF4386 domain-containing protein [Lunatibacter salilacus]|uniref:DUF4386 domain-containing protein n=1 Tax=Lunatibacter salilacus TaxID=2483804 RepID=UPI00131DAAAA|nr:DUF4386 domain-containing protein [Lunatibacter salilacus]
MEKTNNNIQRNMALVAGFSLIAMALLAAFGYGYGFSTVYVVGNPAETLNNLNQSSFLIRLVILSFTAILILDVVIGWALYYFFKTVNEPIALLSAWLRLTGAAFLGIALMNLSAVLQLMNNFPKNQELIMNGFRTFLDVWSLGLIVFAFHLFAVAWLMAKVDTIPKVLSLLALFAAFCYLITNSAHLLLPDYEIYKGTVDLILGAPMAIGELGLAVWLIFKGGKKTATLSRFHQSLSNSTERFRTNPDVTG